MENIILNDDIITLDTTIMAKKIKFYNNSKSIYVNGIHSEQGISPYWDYFKDDIYSNVYFAPTQSFLRKWLRKIHNMHIVIIPFAIDSTDPKSECKYHYEINKQQFYGFVNADRYGDGFDSYELALEKALQEILELIN